MGDYEDDEYMEGEEDEVPPPSASWLDALQAQFGSVPWWVVSTTVHVVVLLLMTLIVVATPAPETTDAIIPMDLVKAEEPEEEVTYDEKPLFQQDRNIDMEEIVEHPVFVHEEVEVRDHMETENNMDNNTARGQEDAISDIPLGGTGVVGNLGVGGGGAGCYGFRDGGGRKRAALKGGGSRKSEEMVDNALRWLVKNQEPAGNWAVQRWAGTRFEECTVGVTGLALLAFLGAGHTEKTGKHKNTVRMAVDYLMKQQAANGALGQNNDPFSGGGYNHAIAGLALAEAFGMAQVAATGVAAQKAIDYSVNGHQCEYDGWRYSAKMAPDTSVSGWFIMQLKSAKVAGLRVDGKGFQGAIAWLDKVQDLPGAGGEYAGKARYQPGTAVSASMTAVALLGRQFMGWKRSDPLLIGAADFLAQNLPQWGTSPQTHWGVTVPFYYWYYGTLGMFQMGGDWWKQWNASLRDMLIQNQIKSNDPATDGSWEPIGEDGKWAGRAYSTAMGCLCLEVYYRYLPMYK